MKDRHAFTLIELLAVIATIGLLSAITVPVTSNALKEAKSAKCQSHLRSMAQAVGVYLTEHNGSFPMALEQAPGNRRGWDFVIEGSGSSTVIRPGVIWESYGVQQNLQCPSFDGSANSPNDPYTGYNYNASYLGGMRIEAWGFLMSNTRSANILHVRSPSQTAMFGDGEYANGANKFMRAPFPGALDEGFSGREAGTQGFRHNDRTNVAFVDGRVASLRPTDAPVSYAGQLGPSTGFLSADNSLYDLD